MFSRLTFQSMHFKLSSFPITQLMNRNNAIPHIRGSLSCTEGPSWVRWWAVTHPGFITVWFIPMAARTCLDLEVQVWAKKNKIYLLRLLNSHCQSFVLNSQSKTWAGNSNAVFFNRQNWPPNQKQLVVCSQLAVNFQPAHLYLQRPKIAEILVHFGLKMNGTGIESWF